MQGGSPTVGAVERKGSTQRPYAVGEADQTRAPPQGGPAHAVVAYGQAQQVVVGPHGDAGEGGEGMLGGIGQCLRSDIVGRHLDRLGQPPGHIDIDLDRYRRAARQSLERGGQTALGKDGRMNTAGEFAQLLEHRQQRIGGPAHRGSQLRSIRGYRALGGPQFQHQGHQVLLGAVMQDSGHGVGYLLKSRVSDVQEFLDAMQRVARGGAVVDPALVRELVSARRREDPLAVLSAREREVLELMAEGRSNAGIARRLWVTEGTVEKHVRSILAKLNLPETDDDHRRVRAVITFLEAR